MSPVGLSEFFVFFQCLRLKNGHLGGCRVLVCACRAATARFDSHRLLLRVVSFVLRCVEAGGIVWCSGCRAGTPNEEEARAEEDAFVSSSKVEAIIEEV